MKVLLNTRLVVVGMLLASLPFTGEAKSYSSGGGKSYSSSSSHSSSSGSRSGGSSSGSRNSGSSSSRSSSPPASKSSPSGGSSSRPSYKSGSGKSYSSSSTSNDDGRKSYTSGKSYTATSELPKSSPKPAFRSDSDPARFNFDNAAARAQKEEASRREFSRFQESQRAAAAPREITPPATLPTRPANSPDNSSYRVQPPPISNRRNAYVPDERTVYSRPARMRTVFVPYFSRPTVLYRDSYNSLFWWWLLDRSLDDRAYWAYHHRYDMDPARYRALVADNQQLEARVEQLETQRVPRDPAYVPPDLDRDLMYSDRHVSQAYANRPTSSGSIAFWVLAIPAAVGGGCFFIWLIFFKRWQTSTP